MLLLISDSSAAASILRAAVANDLVEDFGEFRAPQASSWTTLNIGVSFPLAL